MWCTTNYLLCIIYALYYLLVTGIFISHFWLATQLIFPTTTWTIIFFLQSPFEELWREINKIWSERNREWAMSEMPTYTGWVVYAFFSTCDFCFGFHLSVPVLIKIQLLQLNILWLFLCFFYIWTHTVLRKFSIILYLIVCDVGPFSYAHHYKIERTGDKKCALGEQQWYRS